VWEAKATKQRWNQDTTTEQRDWTWAFNTEARHGDWRHVAGPANSSALLVDDVKGSRHVWQLTYDL